MKKIIPKIVLLTFIIGCFSFKPMESFNYSFEPVENLSEIKLKIGSSSNPFQPQTVTIVVVYENGTQQIFSSYGCEYSSALACSLDKARSYLAFSFTVTQINIKLHNGQCL